MIWKAWGVPFRNEKQLNIKAFCICWKHPNVIWEIFKLHRKKKNYKSRNFLITVSFVLVYAATSMRIIKYFTKKKKFGED